MPRNCFSGATAEEVGEELFPGGGTLLRDHCLGAIWEGLLLRGRLRGPFLGAVAEEPLRRSGS